MPLYLEDAREQASIFLHLRFETSPDGVQKQEWKRQIEAQVKDLFLHHLTRLAPPSSRIDESEIEFEIFDFDGCWNIRLKPKLKTLLLIINLYFGAHEAYEKWEYIQHDYEWLRREIPVLVERITNAPVQHYTPPQINSWAVIASRAAEGPSSPGRLRALKRRRR